MNSKQKYITGLMLLFLLTILVQHPIYAQITVSVSSPRVGQEVVYRINAGCSNTVWSVSGLPYTLTGPSSDTTLSLAWYSPGTGTVTATSWCGGSRQYSVNSTVMPIELGVPGNLRQVYGTCTSISVAWNPVNEATGYYLDVATDINFDNKVSGYNNLQIGKVSSYTVNSDIFGGTTYYVRLRAYDAYSLGAYSNTATCSPNTSNDLVYTVTGGGSYCFSGGGIPIGLNGSQTGVSYRLFRGSTGVGTPVSGTGNAINFGNQTAAGTYTVKSTNNTSMCSRSMSGEATVTVKPLPALYNITGGGAYCSGGTGVPVGLNSSQTGISYKLFRGSTVIEASVAGTGNAISFGNQTSAGTYTVTATNSTTTCSRSMSGEATVTVKQSPTVSAGPNLSFFIDNSATILTGGNPTGGSWSGTGVSGSTFTPSIAGTGTHTVTYSYTSNGCTGSSNRIVTVLAKPIVTISGPDTSLPRGGGTVALTTGTYDGYQWYRDNILIGGATNKNYLATVVGAYKVRTTKNGAVSYSTDLRVANALDQMSGNYIRSTTIMQAGVTNKEDVDGLAIGQVNEQISYFDGLGRPMQTVQVQGSPLKNDIVQPIVYDQFGREPVKYLPYVSSESNGWYKPNPIGMVSENGLPGSNYTTSAQYQFYNNTGTDIIATDQKPYAASVIEPSPLNRILKQGAPGETWQPNPDVNFSDRSIKFKYKANAADEVYLWGLNASDLPVIDSTRYYDANQLYKNVTLDEHDNQVIEYKDKQGRVILKKVQVDPIPEETTHIGWACTYYIYDDFGDLRFVLPPEMVKLIGNNLAAGYVANVYYLNDWAFLYKYDSRRRMIEKKLPGVGWVYMVYDTHDRLILTQDGNQRVAGTSSFGTNREWTFTKYDALNRPVLTGIYTHPTPMTQSAMQDHVNNNMGEVGNAWYESRSTDTQNVHGYDNASWPKISDTTRYLSVTYYDDYLFTTETVYEYPANLPAINLINPKGQVTGGKIKRLDNHSWYTSVVYYDHKYRPIYNIAQNHLQGYEKVMMDYDFVGNLVHSHHEHSTSGQSTLVINKQFEYDHANRLMEVKSRIGDNGEYSVIARHEYNELGELVTKKLHSPSPDNYKQAIDYRYNIRGWLTAINDPDNIDINGGDYFGMTLHYNDPLANNQLGSEDQYNGNISEIHWKNAQDNTRKTYGFQYDKLNRMRNSSYGEGQNFTENKGFYDENILGYDYNGNITGLTRAGNGLNDNLIDNLTYYNYGTGYGKSNKLISVSDAASITEKELGFKDGNTGQDYWYDSNGNLTKDLNKGISSIAYNHLNLPKLITKGDSTIQYVYDATGVKLQKKVSKNGTVVKTTDYVGALVYEGTADKFLNTEEGRVVLKENGQEKEEYQYHLKDHLGNVRVTFTTADREELTSTYLLTMEPEFAVLEGETFGNLETRQVDKLYNKTVGGKASAKLNAISGKAVGPSMSLSVMPGDTVKMTVHAKYDQKASTKDAVTGIAAIVASAFTPEDATPEMSQLINQAMLKPLGASQVALFAKDNTIPKAYLNYLFFDKKMKYKKGGFQQITEAAHGKFEEITLDFAPEEEGYLMVYVANQTAENIDVFFDQMAVEHTSGPIIRVDDYYPFGMAFNTGTLAGALTNKYLYNGKELQQELGLDWYDYGARMYDAAVGRWHAMDPLQQFHSPYVYAANNPIRFIDPSGMYSTEEWKRDNGITDDDLITIYKASDNSSSNEDSSDNSQEANDPTPYPSSKLGDLDYYKFRFNDFKSRYGSNSTPPSYYLEYGDKYARKFTFETSLKLTFEGRQWLSITRRLLQRYMEQGLQDPNNKGIELNDQKFTAFAFGTHPDAYIDGGLLQLGFGDKLHIFNTVDLIDLARPEGMEQVKIIMKRQIDFYNSNPSVLMNHIKNAPSDFVKFFSDYRNFLPPAGGDPWH